MLWMMLDSLGTGLSKLTQASYCAEPAGPEWWTGLQISSPLFLQSSPGSCWSALLIQKHSLCSSVEPRSFSRHPTFTVPPCRSSSICVFSTLKSSFYQILSMYQKVNLDNNLKNNMKTSKYSDIWDHMQVFCEVSVHSSNVILKMTL